MSDIVKRAKPKGATNRLRLSPDVIEKANLWLSQLENEFNGMLNLKRNDVINFLLEEFDEKLSQPLMDKIKDKKLTDKQRAKWIYQKFLEAEKQGIDLDFNDVIKVAQAPSKKKRKPRRTQNKGISSATKKDSQSDNFTNNFN